jgi:hypothetical protein
MGKVYILDEVQPNPGGVETYRLAYLEQYAPSARSRGLTLEAVRLHPPIELPEGGNTLSFLWSAPDVAGFWKARLNGEAEKAAWWARSAELAVTRTRRVFADLPGAD